MSPQHIQVFEHRSLDIGVIYNGIKFERKHYDALFKLNELHNDKYFRMLPRGVCFRQYVGVIRVAGLTIEVLPKIDNMSNDAGLWQQVLIDMLRVAQKLKVHNIDQAHVEKQRRHLLDIYFEWYLTEVNLLLHRGLIKKYYLETGNVKSLKGKLQFAGHIRKNLVHKERFYTTHQVYGTDHIIHQILAKALDIVARFSKGSYVYSICQTVKASFPEVSEVSVTAETFKNLKQSRKTAPYKTALEIAKFIILQFAPDVKGGNEDMLALLFDMNMLWEQYILAKLREAAVGTDISVHAQTEKHFWNSVTSRPDIVVHKKNPDEKYIIDTKWKNLAGSPPSPQDLRQMYVYNDYWHSEKALLLYPGIKSRFEKFTQFHSVINETSHACGLAEISVILPTGELNKSIGEEILNFLDKPLE